MLNSPLPTVAAVMWQFMEASMKKNIVFFLYCLCQEIVYFKPCQNHDKKAKKALMVDGSV